MSSDSCKCLKHLYFFFFQAEGGIRYLVRSRGLGDVYKRQPHARVVAIESEREFGLSVLQGLKAESDRRGRLFLSLIHI